METKVKLDFYNIESFGYYKKNVANPEFGDLADILNQLNIWLKDKNISETNTYTNFDQENSVLQVYCPQLLNNTAKSSFFLNLWNETPNNNGSVQSLQGNEPVGSVNIKNTNVPEGGIPGFPSYFWFLPEQNLFACVRINESLQTGRKEMEKYILGFMKKYSQYVRPIESEENPEGRQILFAESEDSEPHFLYPRFTSKQSKHKTKIQELQQNYSKIKKIIKKETISLSNTPKKSIFNRLRSFFLLSPLPKSDKKVKYRYELESTLTKDELNNIISSYDYRNYKYEDIAFCFDNNKKIWLSQTVCKIEDSLDIEFNKQTPKLQSLFDAIEQQRNNFLFKIR